ncbi:hypothetical protein [Flavobacterium phycosphaerae]|uniref:hypothetical protein n=1 Tax=Flavobacterium phycosphaerae TaxID=2697515 RepID=UPI00138ABB21|nr:hypothetical protein [Flavobacterium phycosphaerae]
MRIFLPLVFVLLYAAWVLYRALLKKDLLKHKAELYAGLFFIGVWGVLYSLLELF